MTLTISIFSKKKMTTIKEKKIFNIFLILLEPEKRKRILPVSLS